MSQSNAAVQSFWLSDSWKPSTIPPQPAFDSDELKNILERIWSVVNVTPPRRHNKNLAETKHGVLRSLYLSLVSASPSMSNSLIHYYAAPISNDLYGKELMLSFELRHGFSKPVVPRIKPLAFTP